MSNESRNVRKISKEAEKTVAKWEQYTALHRMTILTAAVLAFSTLPEEEQYRYLSTAMRQGSG